MDDRGRAKPAPAGTAPFKRASTGGGAASEALSLATSIDAQAGKLPQGDVLAMIVSRLQSAEKKLSAQGDDITTLKSGIA